MDRGIAKGPPIRDGSQNETDAPGRCGELQVPGGWINGAWDWKLSGLLSDEGGLRLEMG